MSVLYCLILRDIQGTIKGQWMTVIFCKVMKCLSKLMILIAVDGSVFWQKSLFFFFFMKCSNNIHTDLYEILGEDHMNPVVAEWFIWVLCFQIIACTRGRQLLCSMLCISLFSLKWGRRNEWKFPWPDVMKHLSF